MPSRLCLGCGLCPSCIRNTNASVCTNNLIAKQEEVRELAERQQQEIHERARVEQEHKAEQDRQRQVAALLEKQTREAMQCEQHVENGCRELGGCPRNCSLHHYEDGTCFISICGFTWGEWYSCLNILFD